MTPACEDELLAAETSQGFLSTPATAVRTNRKEWKYGESARLRMALFSCWACQSICDGGLWRRQSILELAVGALFAHLAREQW